MSQNKSTQPPFFVIEGNDGVGKSTQVSRLVNRLETDGRLTHQIKFPRYNLPASYFAKHYLDGGYGSVDEVGPKQASILFAVDRFDFKLELEEAVGSGRLVLADRYVASNLAHQGSKIDDQAERREFFDWVINFEYELLGVVRPTVNLILLVDVAVSRRLRAERNLRLGPEFDVHVGDEHQERTHRVYRELCQLFPEEFVAIDCQDGERLKSEEEIGQLVYAAVEPHLVQRPAVKEAK